MYAFNSNKLYCYIASLLLMPTYALRQKPTNLFSRKPGRRLACVRGLSAGRRQSSRSVGLAVSVSLSGLTPLTLPFTDRRVDLVEDLLHQFQHVVADSADVEIDLAGLGLDIWGQDGDPRSRQVIMSIKHWSQTGSNLSKI
jgi:hypothetical protein